MIDTRTADKKRSAKEQDLDKQLKDISEQVEGF